MNTAAGQLAKRGEKQLNVRDIDAATLLVQFTANRRSNPVARQESKSPRDTSHFSNSRCVFSTAGVLLAASVVDEEIRRVVVQGFSH